MTTTTATIEPIREIAATTQVHGATRVIELTTFTVTDGFRAEVKVQLTAYDSNHPHDSKFMLIGPCPTQAVLEQVRADAADILRPSKPGEGCSCWAGWDPHCGDANCWGIWKRPAVRNPRVLVGAR